MHKRFKERKTLIALVIAIILILFQLPALFKNELPNLFRFRPTEEFQGVSTIEVPADEQIQIMPEFVAKLTGTNDAVVQVIVYILFGLMVFAFLATNFKLALGYILTNVAYFLILNNTYNMPITEAHVSIFFIILLIFTCLFILLKHDKKNFLMKLLSFSELIKFLKTKIKKPALIFVAIFVLVNLSHSLTYINFVDNKTNSTNYIAEFLDTLEDGSVLIEGEYNAADTLRLAVRDKTKNHFDYYSIFLESFDDVNYHLAYDGEYYRTINTTTYTSEKLKETFKDLSGKYEHVYYFVQAPTCNGVRTFHDDVMQNYEIAKVLNSNEEDLKIGQYPVQVFKIK